MAFNMGQCTTVVDIPVGSFKSLEQYVLFENKVVIAKARKIKSVSNKFDKEAWLQDRLSFRSAMRNKCVFTKGHH